MCVLWVNLPLAGVCYVQAVIMLYCCSFSVLAQPIHVTRVEKYGMLINLFILSQVCLVCLCREICQSSSDMFITAIALWYLQTKPLRSSRLFYFTSHLNELEYVWFRFKTRVHKYNDSVIIYIPSCNSNPDFVFHWRKKKTFWMWRLQL